MTCEDDYIIPSFHTGLEFDEFLYKNNINGDDKYANRIGHFYFENMVIVKKDHTHEMTISTCDPNYEFSDFLKYDSNDHFTISHIYNTYEIWANIQKLVVNRNYATVEFIFEENPHDLK
jgi:hypothetical protein